MVWYNGFMKKFFRAIFYCITLMLICQPLPVMAANGKDVENFYFEDFTADYYVTKGSDGISHMKVIEEMTAVFPDYEQNKGIVRKIPFTNQDGKNIVMKDLTEAKIKVTRNGEPEPIYSLERNGDYYEVSTGTNDYVTGEQVYQFEYTFDKVVTDFDSYQEIYWDTNGTGWPQKFNNLTARVHFDSETDATFTGNTWCYVGKNGEKGENRCKTKKTVDGFEFSTTNLEKSENLTFDVELKAGSFTIPEPDGSYVPLIVVSVILGIFIIFYLRLPLKKWLETKPKRRFYKDLFVKPEYQPNPHYSLSELGAISFKRKGDLKVAMLLDLAVREKVEIIESEKTETETETKWNVRIKNLTDLPEEEINLLKLLNGGDQGLAEGRTIKIRSQLSNREARKIRKFDKAIYKTIVEKLKKDGLIENSSKPVDAIGDIGAKRRIGELIIDGIVDGIAYLPVIALIFAVVTFGVSIVANMWEAIYGGIALYESEMCRGAFIIVLVIVLIRKIVDCSLKKVECLTKEGLKIVREMDGLYLYMKMAEAERLKFLQSVEGADISPEGVVRLYEKLLPYAVIFGLEKSWLTELQQYCETEGVAVPSAFGAGVSIQSLSAFSASASSSFESSSSFTSSSGFSGGGGGGSSGGGGGGGGGGGR